MARSLAKIKEQIARLQKEADAIQSDVIARIRREIAQHGLTAEHLFGTSAGVDSGNSKSTRAGKAAKPGSAKKTTSDKPAKFADDQGNTWHGMGKRPQWLHAALSAGRTLEELLISGQKPAANATVKPKAKSPRAGKQAATPSRKKAAAKRRSAKGAKASAVPAKPPRKSPAAAKKAPVKKSPAKKAVGKRLATAAPEAAKPAAT